VTTPPLLEMYVLWHPLDANGARLADGLHRHFHGPAYAGLAGGAVEVYRRSGGWLAQGGPPRPMPFQEPLPYGLPSAQFTVVVPVMSPELMAAAEDPDWSEYLQQVSSAAAEETVFVLPVRRQELNLHGSRLSRLFGSMQAIDGSSPDTVAFRDVAQATAESLASGPDRVTVFVSHTKHRSSAEEADGTTMYDEVRAVLAGTHLAEFFDARDLLPGSQWKDVLDREAGRNALLMVRTDNYAQREWTQREVLRAKEHDLACVVLYALQSGDDRGSFLMDHVPAIPCDLADPAAGIRRALDRLVDEVLKHALWRRQTVYLAEHGFDWLPARAPEAVTLLDVVAGRRRAHPLEVDLAVIHPDPPLGPNEQAVLTGLARVAGYTGQVDFVTPRQFADRGGEVG